MYKLFAAAQAIEFSDGCHARWSSFVVKSNELPLASAAGLSAPATGKPTFLELSKSWNYKINSVNFILKRTWASFVLSDLEGNFKSVLMDYPLNLFGYINFGMNFKY